MKTIGFITEYNPFHNGHLYHMQKAREITGGNSIICVMNGNFMQRGRPAITDKWSRTKMALSHGVDLVLELPLVYGIRSAEYFARGAVLTLASTGIVDSLVFGSESGNIDILKKISRILIKEPVYFQNLLKKYLKEGISFPAAREKALLNYYYFSEPESNLDEIEKSINTPNNILGIEYLKILYENNIDIKPLTIKRKGEHYHSTKATGNFLSASAIRNLIYNSHNFSKIRKALPPSSHKYLEEDIKKGKIPICRNHLGIMILAKLRQQNVDSLQKYTTADSGLEKRINEFAYSSGSLTKLVEKIKTKAYTQTRIERLLLHILFDLTKKEFELIDKKGLQYLRILGFNQNGEKLLAKIKKKSSLPLITQPADYLNTPRINSQDPLIKMLSFDLIASDIYTLLYKKPEKRKGHLDFYRPVIKM